MARVVLGSYVIRFPLGGYLSWVLQWMVGFKRLGHEVYFVEKAGWANACFDPSKNRSSDDCGYGAQTWNSLLARFGLQDRWCFVDFAGRYHGLSRERLRDVFRSSDAFIDMGTHGAWMEDAAEAKLRVLIDGEPAATQMKMENQIADGGKLPDYDFLLYSWEKPRHESMHSTHCGQTMAASGLPGQSGSLSCTAG